MLQKRDPSVAVPFQRLIFQLQFSVVAICTSVVHRMFSF